MNFTHVYPFSLQDFAHLILDRVCKHCHSFALAFELIEEPIKASAHFSAVLCHPGGAAGVSFLVDMLSHLEQRFEEDFHVLVLLTNLLIRATRLLV